MHIFIYLKRYNRRLYIEIIKDIPNYADVSEFLFDRSLPTYIYFYDDGT